MLTGQAFKVFEKLTASLESELQFLRADRLSAQIQANAFEQFMVKFKSKLLRDIEAIAVRLLH